MDGLGILLFFVLVVIALVAEYDTSGNKNVDHNALRDEEKQ
jgi:hypothetical protein